MSTPGRIMRSARSLRVASRMPHCARTSSWVPPSLTRVLAPHCAPSRSPLSLLNRKTTLLNAVCRNSLISCPLNLRFQGAMGLGRHTSLHSDGRSTGHFPRQRDVSDSVVPSPRSADGINCAAQRSGLDERNVKAVICDRSASSSAGADGPKRAYIAICCADPIVSTVSFPLRRAVSRTAASFRCLRSSCRFAESSRTEAKVFRCHLSTYSLARLARLARIFAVPDNPIPRHAPSTQIYAAVVYLCGTTLPNSEGSLKILGDGDREPTAR